ncbi:MAG: ribulose-phosphate 3-epimerase [Clostridiales bacterium]|nr:ribulose-phosphate 3-epimerase [Clostridiales bacterium]
MANFLKVAPSTDPCKDKDDLLVYVKRLNNIADYVHCDVMHENFVGHTTINERDVKDIYLHTLLPLDVHLMVNEPLKLVEKYIKAGAKFVTVHFEAFKNKKDLIKCLKKINSLGALAGLAIKPNTEVGEILEFLANVELVLVMSVEPGKSGQLFKESTYSKIKKLKQIRESYGARFKIEVDGGIVPEISKKLSIYGADIVVSGSYVFNAIDKQQAIEELK